MQRRAALIAAVIAVVLVGGILYWSPWTGTEPEPEPALDPAPTPTKPVESEPVAEPRPAPALPLPSLDESDALARELAGGLSEHRALDPFLSSEGLVRTFVVVVVNVANGESPVEHVSYMEPEQDFQVVERDGRIWIDPASYARYDRLAAAFSSVNVLGAVRAFQRAEPLLDQAYRNLGYPDGRFAEALDRAMIRLIDTPSPGVEVELRERTERYEYADPELEALSAPEKLLLRMGPRNAQRIKAMLRELRELMYAEGILGE